MNHFYVQTVYKTIEELMNRQAGFVRHTQVTFTVDYIYARWQ
jgi:hypothetical protein